MSISRCSPEPSRECNNMFLTIASARLPCCTTLSRLPRNVAINSVISSRLFSLRVTSLRASCNSPISSAETTEKLLTKLSGCLISCALPPGYLPSAALRPKYIPGQPIHRRHESPVLQVARGQTHTLVRVLSEYLSYNP